MTRSKLIQIWFAAVLVAAVAGLAFGTTVTMGTGAMLLALCLLPPAMILKLWPAVQTQTIAEVLYDTEQRR